MRPDETDERRNLRSSDKRVYSENQAHFAGCLAPLPAAVVAPGQHGRNRAVANLIERCFVEGRRRTRPMVCFVNEASVDRVVYAIFGRFNHDGRNRTLRLFAHAA